jgi:DNA-3-methyladenine glycosylase II
MNYLEHLSKDKKLIKILDKKNPVILTKEKNIYLFLCYSIMSQQLSTKVAEIIKERFLEIYKSKKPSLEDIAATPFATLKSIGLSDSKVNYILNVCDYFIEHKITDAKLHKMTDEELIQTLTSIKGVGRWTVEMVMMFAMEREDVFSADDLGIQQRMCSLYGIDNTSKKQMKIEMENIAAKWSPFRTYACRYLWSWKEELIFNV